MAEQYTGNMLRELIFLVDRAFLSNARESKSESYWKVEEQVLPSRGVPAPLHLHRIQGSELAIRQ